MLWHSASYITHTHNLVCINLFSNRVCVCLLSLFPFFSLFLLSVLFYTHKRTGHCSQDPLSSFFFFPIWYRDWASSTTTAGQKRYRRQLLKKTIGSFFFSLPRPCCPSCQVHFSLYKGKKFRQRVPRFIFVGAPVPFRKEVGEGQRER